MPTFARPQVPAPGGETPRAVRFDRIDALRGAALVWMATFHFCFDLSNWRVLRFDFYHDPFWLTQRTLILSTFLLCAGAGQALATSQGQSWGRFWRRWVQVLGCALLVSAGSWAMFGERFISFGVLHGMAVMLLIARLTAPWRAWLWPLGLLAVLAPQLWTHPWFDSRATNWIGLVTHKPITEDFVPVLPWLGVMWWGLAATQWLLQHRPGWLGTVPVSTDSGDNVGLARWPWQLLVTLGRWSLTFYMVHQPVMLALLAAWLWWMGLPIPV